MGCCGAVVGMEAIVGRFLTPLNPSRTYGPSAGVTTNRAGKCRMSSGTARQSVLVDNRVLYVVNQTGGKTKIDLTRIASLEFQGAARSEQ